MGFYFPGLELLISGKSMMPMLTIVMFRLVVLLVLLLVLLLLVLLLARLHRWPRCGMKDAGLKVQVSKPLPSAVETILSIGSICGLRSRSYKKNTLLVGFPTCSLSCFRFDDTNHEERTHAT